MSAEHVHVVGLRELRHKTAEVLARVRHGETIDVTAYGRLIARIIPVEERPPTPVFQQLVDAGRVQRASRPGVRPHLLAGDGTDQLSEALGQMRDQERW